MRTPGCLMMQCFTGVVRPPAYLCTIAAAVQIPLRHERPLYIQTPHFSLLPSWYACFPSAQLYWPLLKISFYVMCPSVFVIIVFEIIRMKYFTFVVFNTWFRPDMHTVYVICLLKGFTFYLLLLSTLSLFILSLSTILSWDSISPTLKLHFPCPRLWLNRVFYVYF